MPDIQPDSGKAFNFLQAFRSKGYQNLVAIDPVTGFAKGITRPNDHQDLRAFIEKHNGTFNLYFSVNEPSSSAPDGKLKKHNINLIHAVWLDADPKKGLPLEREKERLAKFAAHLKASENPPTYITDSGGGIQAFWLFDKPLDATKENIIYAESLSRGLAEQYGTDFVQNIDRIMRIPFTINIPTKKKKGRVKTIAKIIYAKSREGRRYPNLDFIMPSYKADAEEHFEHTDVDMEAIKQLMPDDLLARLKDTLQHDLKAHDIYYGLIEKPSRSEYDFTLTQQLVWANYTIQEVAHILYHYTFGKNTDLTKREIIRNYNRVDNPFVGLDPAYIAKIEAQVNPILAARAVGKPMVEDLKQSTKFMSIKLKDMDWKFSGAPIYKNLLYQNAITVIYGQSNVGKSFVVADIAGHIALGRDWGNFKYKVKERIAVVYICAEAGKSFGKRGKALRKRLAVDDIPFYVIDAAPNFAKQKEDAKAIVEEIKRIEERDSVKVGLMVVDTLATTFEGGNENSSEDMGLYISNMKYIQRYADTGVLIVHHSGKDQAAGARGHSSLRAATDTEIEITSEKKGERYHRLIQTKKQREGESGITIKFGLAVVELGRDDDGDPIDTCHIVLENDIEFESVFSKPQDELTGTKKAAYLTVLKFQEPDFLKWCKGKGATEIRKFMVKYWFLIKSDLEKILSLEALERADNRYDYNIESSNFSGDFNGIRSYLNNTSLKLNQWIKEHLVKPSQALSL